MGRISEEELEGLKQSVSWEELAASKNLELKKRGKDLVGLCPFHEETEPSFHITPEKGVYHCFGCNAGGDVISWIQKMEGVSFRQAVELLRAGYPAVGAGLGPMAGEKLTKKSTIPKLPCPLDAEASLQEVLAQVMDYYHETLVERGPAGLEYLKKRRVSEEAIYEFKLGYCDRTLGYRLPGRNRKAGEELRGKLEELGILRKSGHELFRGAVTVPLFDESGQVVQAYGRKIGEKIVMRPDTQLHMNLDGPLKGIFNKKALSEHAEVIVCEAIFDALTFWSAGFRNVVASRGASNFNEEHIEALVKAGTKRVLIAFDRDKAGDEAAQKLAERLMKQGIECFRVEFPQGQDANEYALSQASMERALEERIRKSVWMGKRQAAKQEARASSQDEGRAASADLKKGEGLEGQRGVGNQEPVFSLAADVSLEAEAQAEADGLKGSLEPKKPEPRQPKKKQEARPEPEERRQKKEELKGVTPKEAPEEMRVKATNQEPSAVPGTPKAPAKELQYTIKEGQIDLTQGNRNWRIKGYQKNNSLDRLSVSLHVTVGDEFHQDKGDLYSARWRGGFIKQAAAELGLQEETIKRDVGRILLLLEELHESMVQDAQKAKAPAWKMLDGEREAALAFLKAPNLFERILRDFEKIGMVGERINKLFGYLAATSRKLEDPLAIIVQSSSAAGKTALMEAVLAFMPDEDKAKYSAMTGQSLFYLGETDLQYKILAIVEEAGAQKASYALKLLQSEGEISIASTGKDGKTGKLMTQEYRVKGPVMIFLTTTSIELDEELQNRCVILSVDDGREQTRAIQSMQRERETLAGLWAKEEKQAVIKLHQNAQRLLRPLSVVNPYARELTFLDEKARQRRDNKKYLVLIRAIALLRQYQKQVLVSRYEDQSKQYIEVEPKDIELANELAHETLGRWLEELPPPTRRMLLLVYEMVQKRIKELGLEQAEFRFSRKEVRQYTSWTDFQVKMHMKKLEELEYVLVHRGGRGQSFVYELLYDGKGQDGKPFVMGLLDVRNLKRIEYAYDSEKEILKGQKEPSSSLQVAQKEPGSRMTTGHDGYRGSDAILEEVPKNAVLGDEAKMLSYLQENRNGSLAHAEG